MADDRSKRRRNVAKLGPFLPVMRLRRPIPLLALLLVATLAASAAQAEGYSRAAEAVLARAFAATGGKSWYLLRGWRETGQQDGRAYEAWIDPLRYGLRSELREPDGLRIDGFNGQAVWQVAPDGAITAVKDHPTLAKARTEAFFAANGFFFRGRFDGRGDHLGVHQLGGRSYDVLRVQPGGGEPRELWFDRKSHLLRRIVDRTGPQTGALQVSDYRKVGPVLIAFRIAPEGGAKGGGETDPLVREREHVVFAPTEREHFSLNRPQELARVAAAARTAGSTAP